MAGDEIRRQDVRRADEIGDEARIRLLVDLLGRADLHDLAVVEDGDAVGHGQRLALIVGDEDEGDAERFLQRLQLFLHVFAQLQVERAERFVEQQDFRPVDERPGERDALALAAGKLARPARAVTRQLDHLKRRFRLAPAFGLVDALDHQPVGDVVGDIQMREQRVVLEYGVDVAAIGRDAFGALSENLDFSGSRLLETGNQPRQVVLPEPEGPSMAKNSPGLMSRSTASTAFTEPKWRETFWNETAGVMVFASIVP